MPVFAAHCGRHVAPQAPRLSLFRRLVGVLRKSAVPAELPPAAELRAAGAATPPDGVPVLGDRMLSDVRREHDQLTDAEIAALHPRGRHPYPPLRPTRLLRPAGDGEIVIGPDNRVSVCPWPPAARPVWAEPEGRGPVRDTRMDVTAPHYAPDTAPVYGQACTADVLAIEAAGQEGRMAS